MKKKISLKDKKDWEKFIKSSDKLENKDLNYYETIRNVNKKTIDLHGYTLNEANNKIKELIEAVDKDTNKIHEAADVFYHLIIYLEAHNIKIEDIEEELKKRKKSNE